MTLIDRNFLCRPTPGSARFVALAGPLLALLMLALLPHPAQAQGLYPTRPVRIVLPFAAGSVSDVAARLIAAKLGDRMKGQFDIDNRPGADGIAAARAVLAAPRDGYTLTLLSDDTAIEVSRFKKLPYDPVKDFAPVSSLGYFDFIFAAAAQSPYKTLANFIDAAKQKPGALTVGTLAIGSAPNLTAELLKTAAGINVLIIPYPGMPELQTALLQDDLALIVTRYSRLKPALAAGKIRALAASAPLRSKTGPDIPTLRESGIEANVESWYGLFAPAGAPPGVIAALQAALQAILAEPELKAQLLNLGIDAKASTPDQMAARLKSDIEKWRNVIEKAGLERR